MIIVYTCIVDDYDDLIAQPTFNGVRYICFSDSIHSSHFRNWEIFPIPNTEIIEPNLINRFVKAYFFELGFEEEFSMYIDGNVLLKSDPTIFLDQFKQSSASIAAFKHPYRQNILQELDELIRVNKLSSDEIDKTNLLLKRMKDNGFDFQSTLTAGYIILRKHNDNELKISMRSWLNIIMNECKRDQMSLQYVLWRNNIEMMLLDSICDSASFFKRYNHGNYLDFIPRNHQDFLKKVMLKIRNIYRK